MFKIKILANKDAVSGRSLPPYTVVEDDDNVDDAIDEVNKSLNKSRCNGAKIIILTHGEEDGDFKLSDDYDHMSKVMKPIDGGGKPVIFDLYSCHSGHELEKGSQNRKQYLIDISGDEAFKDDGVLLFVNAGGRVTLVDYNADQISRTHQIMDPVRLFMQKILHSPETVKVVRKADASDGSPDDLAVFKYSTPKPQSAAELSDDKIAAFLNQEVTRFCAFIGENPQQYLGELATQLTPNVIRQIGRPMLWFMKL